MSEMEQLLYYCHLLVWRRWHLDYYLLGVGLSQEIVFYNKKAETPLPKTGDGFSKILLYGIFAFVTTANFHLLRERRKRTEKK